MQLAPWRPNHSLARGCRGGIWLTAAGGPVQKVVSHSVVNVQLVQGVMVHHHHFVLILFRDSEPIVAAIHLIGLKAPEGAVGIYVWNGSE